MWLYRLYEFLFDPWTVSILEEGEHWNTIVVNDVEVYRTGGRKYVKYKLTHKFNGYEKIKIKYLN